MEGRSQTEVPTATREGSGQDHLHHGAVGHRRRRQVVEESLNFVVTWNPQSFEQKYQGRRAIFKAIYRVPGINLTGLRIEEPYSRLQTGQEAGERGRGGSDRMG